MDGIVHATYVDLCSLPPDNNNKDVCHPLSPDTTEFVNLERQFMDDLTSPSPPPPPPPPPPLQEPDFVLDTPPSPTPPPPPPLLLSSSHSSLHRRTSESVRQEMEVEEQQRLLLQSELEGKLEERKRSMDLSPENGLQLMERRQLRQFSRADEYLYAMKEDLAEWLNNLYPHIDMDADNFMNKLETGEHLVQVIFYSNK